MKKTTQTLTCMAALALTSGCGTNPGANLGANIQTGALNLAALVPSAVADVSNLISDTKVGIVIVKGTVAAAQTNGVVAATAKP